MKKDRKASKELELLRYPMKYRGIFFNNLITNRTASVKEKTQTQSITQTFIALRKYIYVLSDVA